MKVLPTIFEYYIKIKRLYSAGIQPFIIDKA